MEVISGHENLGIINELVYATFGAFDGVHVAHGKLIRMLVEKSKKINGKSVLITFDPLPKSVIHPGNEAMALTSTEHKIRILKESGLDYVVVIKFDKNFAEISAESFIRDIILRHFPALKEFVIGPRARFGRNGEGDVNYLKKLGAKYGFVVEVTDEMVIDDAIVSSSVIRKFVQSGELDAAEACLGRKYSLYGEVVHGERIGRMLGFPTANINPENEVYPPSGVYAVRVLLDNETLPGVLNIGYRPTLNKRDDLEPAIEVHIIGYSGMIYGKKIEIVFLERLRGEESFITKEALVAQIQKDVEKALDIFTTK